MKNVVNASEFLKAITKVSKVLPKKSSFKILEEVKVEFIDNKCIITGTDIEQIIISEIEANGDNFSFVFKDTNLIIKASKHFDSDLEFVYEDDKIILNSNGKSCKQLTLSVKEYPDIPKIKADNSYDVNSTELFERYNKIKYAVGNDITRPVITGVCFKNNKMVALDGFRMAINTNDNLTVANEIIVPQNALNLLSIYDKNIKLQMQTNDKYIVFTDENTKLISRLIEGEYFDFEKIVPQNSSEEYNVTIKEYINELKYLKEFVNNKNVKTEPVKFEKGILSIQNADGEYSSNVNFGHESDIVYGFNCNYMLDALNQFKDNETVNYKVISRIAPMILSNDNDLALVLPIRLKDVA